MGLGIYTLLHILICLVALAAGFVVVGGWLTAKARPVGVPLMLWSLVLVSVTGFFFPFVAFTPAHAVGIISIITLGVAIYAFYVRPAWGGWLTTYVVAALLAHYLNCFVLVAQLFQKVPVLKALAPTQAEPPFAIAQGLVLFLFVWLGVVVVKAVHRGAVVPAGGVAK